MTSLCKVKKSLTYNVGHLEVGRTLVKNEFNLIWKIKKRVLSKSTMFKVANGTRDVTAKKLVKKVYKLSRAAALIPVWLD